MDGPRNSVTLFYKEDETFLHMVTKSQAALASMMLRSKKGEMPSHRKERIKTCPDNMLTAETQSLTEGFCHP